MEAMYDILAWQSNVGTIYNSSKRNTDTKYILLEW